MSINPIQFQRGLSLPDFLSQYGTEAQCESALEKVRWRDGFRCPQCGHDHCTVFRRGQQPLYQCSACHHQTSLQVGTLFQASKLPLTTWFLAIYLITQAKNGVSALELMRSLGISWRAAWRLKHKILRAMLEQEADRVLRGRVEVDDAYLGGTRSGKRGRGAAGKRPFVIAVETRPDPEGGLPHPVYVRFDPLPDFCQTTLARWAEQALDVDTLMVSDGLVGFLAAGAQVTHHQRVVVHPRKSSELDCFHWINTLLGNLKNSIRGTCHGFKVRKYAARYLAEAQYRFNRRFDLPSLVPRLLFACVHTPPCTEKQLKAAELWT
ncbi:IS1595 family transposase [Thiolapillus sp.]|uniref:IS1595 family transposase n=2 Tax=Thiolapillus sp. TaxID=2017437 RepID=UPI0025FDC074|nr:IS1595 family transposase [Thiolapillus sp.]